MPDWESNWRYSIVAQIISILALSTTVIIVIPRLILPAPQTHLPHNLSFAGLALIIFLTLMGGGFYLGVSIISLLIRVGREILAPWAPKQKLVVSGIYLSKQHSSLHWRRQPITPGKMLRLCLVFVFWAPSLACGAATITVAADGTGNYNCDGTEDEVEINLALEEAKITSGTLIHLKAGTYVINDTVRIYSNTVLEGEGNSTTIKLNDYLDWEESQYAICNGNGAAGDTAITVRDLQIDGNRFNQNHPGGSGWYNVFLMQTTTDSLFENITAFNTADDVFLLNGDNITVRNGHFENIGHAVVRTAQATNIKAYNNFMNHLGNSGIRLEYCVGGEFYNNQIYYAGDGGLQLGQDSDYAQTSHNIFHDNVVGYGGYGINVSYIKHNDLAVGNIFRNNIIYGTHNEGIRIQGTLDSQIINNVIFSVFDTYGHGDGILLTNLDYSNNPAAAKDYPQNAVIKNNIVMNCAGYGIEGQGGTSTYNDFYNNARGNYYIMQAGNGDIAADPLFADAANRDFHLKSQTDRWSGTEWVADTITSPVIDGGDPADASANEPAPNGGRINMGRYGNTAEASRSYFSAATFMLSAPTPASGLINFASGNFTVVPNGTYTGTVTITPSGGGLSTPVTLTFIGSRAAQTFSVTPTAAGTVTLTSANNGGLGNPSPVTYSACLPENLHNAAYPNPVDFTRTNKAVIVYTVSEASSVFLAVYTVAGDRVKTLIDHKTESAGKHSIDWHGDTDGGSKAAGGVYLILVKTGAVIHKIKISVLR